jgi:histidinol-phosphate phosphatase family protein
VTGVTRGWPRKKRRIVLLDRDGTVNVEKGFLADPEKVELIPGAARAIKKLNRAGFAVAIVTNQSGIGRGMYTREQMRATNDRVVAMLKKGGATIDSVEFCPHHPEAVIPALKRICRCRKPGTLMARRAATRTGATLKDCVVVGDRLNDVRMGNKLKGRAVLVLTGYGKAHRLLARKERMRKDGTIPDAIVRDLPAAVEWILHNSKYRMSGKGRLKGRLVKKEG